MDARELSQLRRFEQEVLSRNLKPAGSAGPAVPVGLRYDRLAREGFLPRAGRSEMAGPPEAVTGSETAADSSARAYWTCNCLAVAALLKGAENVLVTCEESWAGEVCLRGKQVTAGPSGKAPARDGGQGKRAAAAPAGAFDAVLSDSSVLLSGDLSEELSGFRRALLKGGRVVLLVANWQYEMDGESIRYDLSFNRYRRNVYAGLVKRTLDPALEVEYVCLLDPAENVVRNLAQLSRDELILRRIADVPALGRLVVSVDVIKIPQATVRSLETAGTKAGFSRSVIAGAPGILAAGACDALPSTNLGPADRICQALALSFPFVPAAGSPHLLAVLTA